MWGIVSVLIVPTLIVVLGRIGDDSHNNGSILSWESQNKREHLKWEIEDRIDSLIKTDPYLAVDYMRNKIDANQDFTDNKLSWAYCLKGDAWYASGNIDSAKRSYEIADQLRTTISPALDSRIAGCLLKQHEFDESLCLLSRAANINYDFYWHLGNYYEVVGLVDSALLYYDRLYEENHEVYRYCHERAEQLRKNKNVKLMEEIEYVEKRQKKLRLVLSPGVSFQIGG